MSCQSPSKLAEMTKRIDAVVAPAKVVRPSPTSREYSELDDLRKDMFDAVDNLGKKAGALTQLRKALGTRRRRREEDALASARRQQEQALAEQQAEALAAQQSEAAALPEDEPKLGSARSKGRPTKVNSMLKAKAHSDKGDYAGKHRIMRGLIATSPDEFIIDSEADGIVGITHMPTGFRMHLPAGTVQDLQLARPVKAAGDAPPVPLEVLGKEASITVEIAEGPWAEMRGLGGRLELPGDRGMLFKRADGFWMRGVNFDLDILFLDKAGTILDIQTMTKLSEGEFPIIYTPMAYGAKLALEVPAGWASGHGVVVGDRIVAGSMEKAAYLAAMMRTGGRMARRLSPTLASTIKRINPIAAPAPGQKLPTYLERLGRHYTVPGTMMESMKYNLSNPFSKALTRVREGLYANTKPGRLDYLRKIRQHRANIRRIAWNAAAEQPHALSGWRMVGRQGVGGPPNVTGNIDRLLMEMNMGMWPQSAINKGQAPLKKALMKSRLAVGPGITEPAARIRAPMAISASGLQ